MNVAFISIAILFAIVVGIEVLMILMRPLMIDNNPFFFAITYMNIGVLVAKSPELIEHLSRRKGVERQRVFFDMPKWYNKYIHNCGMKRIAG